MIATLIISILTVALSLYALVDFFAFKHDKINVAYAMVGAMCFYYGVGTVVGLGVASEFSRNELLASAGLEVDDLIFPQLLVLGYAVFTLAVGRWTPWSSYSRAATVKAIEQVSSRGVNVILLGAIILCEIYLVATGRVSFGGLKTDELDIYKISPLALLVQPLAHACLLLGAYALGSGSSSFAARITSLIALFTQFGYIFMGGRRSAAIAMFLIFLGLKLSGISMRRLRMAISLMAAMYIVSFCVYYALRVAGYSEEVRSAQSYRAIKEQTSGVGNVLGNQNEAAGFWDSLRENISSRPFIIGYFAMLQKAGGVGALGDVTKLSIGTSVPRALWSGKDGMLSSVGGEEEIAYRVFLLPRLTDEANTIITSGYTEIVYVGPILFILAALAMNGWCSILVHGKWPADVKVITVSGMLVTCVDFEASYAAWFVMLRNILLLCLSIWIWQTFFVQGRTSR